MGAQTMIGKTIDAAAGVAAAANAVAIDPYLPWDSTAFLWLKLMVHT